MGVQPVAIVGFSSRVLSDILFPVNPSHLLLEGFKAAMINKILKSATCSTLPTCADNRALMKRPFLASQCCPSIGSSADDC